jgi:SAM-dependent methyltransferase
MPSQSHRSDPHILGCRTLEHDHRRLSGLLRPGLSVLDIGCGTGAITAGIAAAVGPQGYVVGIDRDEVLLGLARTEHGHLRNLKFEHGDATTMTYQSRFDIVTAARTLQWIAEPARAISNMKQAARPGGRLVVLDYNHAQNAWEPTPPSPFGLFYRAFLSWRQANGWDNEMADHLPQLFRATGLAEVEVSIQDEVIERGKPDFAERSRLWSDVIDNVGEQLAMAGYCTSTQLEEARQSYDDWVKTNLVKQTLVMRTVSGTVR